MVETVRIYDSLKQKPKPIRVSPERFEKIKRNHGNRYRLWDEQGGVAEVEIVKPKKKAVAEVKPPVDTSGSIDLEIINPAKEKQGNKKKATKKRSKPKKTASDKKEA